MQTNIKVNQPYRDKYKESCFYDAYKIKCRIETTNFLDGVNWDKVIAKFNIKDNNYGLIEKFKSGADNNTDYVVLEVNGKETKRFDRYIDAELEMVDMIRSE